MKKWMLLGLLLAAVPMCAQDEAPKAQEGAKAPELKFQVVRDFFKIPGDMIMAEAVGVAINSKGHIFILNRGNHPILEFDQEGNFIGSFGEGSPLFRVPHSIRFDQHDNLWYVAAGDNLVVKFDPRRKVEQALGRREGDMGWVYMTHGIERAIPGPSSFYQPTDTVVGPDGDTYVTDGYGNSRVAKFTPEGNLIKYWGDRGTKPGQFNTPHNIVMDANQTLYVADRQNSRVQVFDTDGNFKQEWKVGALAWSLCITPGPNQVIFVGSVGRVFKYDLSGKLLGSFGKLGRLPGWFDSIHALACPDEKTLYLAEEFSYRFDKIVLQ
jgi:DNA-binding beta-propeller fold protein YncE